MSTARQSGTERSAEFIFIPQRVEVPVSHKLRNKFRAPWRLNTPKIIRQFQPCALHLPDSRSSHVYCDPRVTQMFAILIAEDSPQDAELLQLALKRAGLGGPLRFVSDGVEAIAYLEGRGEYADRETFPFPRVIITDLKMPRLNGLELLNWLSDHPECHVIPTILLSGSELSQDITAAYKFGANTYFTKPTDFETLLQMVRSWKEYWSRSELPLIAK